MAQKLFESFLDKISGFPFWVKEVVYIKLREEFETASLSEADLLTPLEEAFQAYVPLITYAGKDELTTRKNDEDDAVYRFLQFMEEKASVAEITLRNFWSLEKTARLVVYCAQKQYINRPTSKKVEATALFIAGRIKIGEYFKRIGKITVDQLDTAIRKQKELESQGKPTQFAEVMISLGYVTERETKAVIYIKEECKKRFIFNANILGKSASSTPAKTIQLNSEFENNTAKGNKENNSSQLVLLRQEIYELQNKLRDIEKIIKR